MKKSVALAMAFSITFLGVNGFGDENTKIRLNQNPKNGEVFVKGYMTGRCIAMVLKGDDTPDTLGESVMPVYISEFLGDGETEHRILMPKSAESGKYTVYLSAKNGKFSESFVYINSSEADEILAKLYAYKQENKKDKFYEAIINNTGKLGINKESDFFKLFAKDISDLLFVTDFNNVSEFNALYGKYGVFCTLNASAPENAAAVLSMYEDNLSVNFQDDILNDKRLKEKSRKNLYEYLTEFDYCDCVIKNGTADFSKILNDGKAISALNGSEGWEKLKTVITTDFNDVFSGIEHETKYNDVNDKNLIFKKLAGKKFNSISEVFAEFKNAAKSVYLSEKRETSTSSSGSSGSGFGSGSITVSEAKPADTLDNDNANNVFTDVTSSHWCYNALMSLYDKQIVSGFEDGEFKGDRKVTRAEFVKMTLGFLQSQEETEKVDFSDVSYKDWFFEYVIKGASCGIVFGNSGMFRPFENVKREDAAVIVYRVMNKNGNAPRGAKFFNDRANVSEYARESVFALAAAGIVNGDGENLFRPSDGITRFEAVQLLYNAFAEEGN